MQEHRAHRGAPGGKHSVGVVRQYSGTLGRIDKCQVATGVYGNNPYSARGASHGFDWQLWEANESGLGNARGITVWGQLTWTPLADVNLTPLGGIAGVSWHGFTDGRPNDTISLSGSRGQEGIELTYGLALTGAVSVLADLQGIFNVSGVARANGFMGGLQLALSL